MNLTLSGVFLAKQCIKVSDRLTGVTSETSDPCVSAGIFSGFENYVARRGARFDALLDAAALTRETLSDLDTTIPMNAAAYLFELAARETGDPCLGIHWAEELPQGSAGVLGYMLVHAKSVRSAAKVIVRYAELQLEPISASFEEAEGVGRLSWRFPVTFVAPRVQITSFLMAVIIIRLRLHAGQNWMPISVDLEHRALECPEEVERILGPNARFDQPCNSVSISESVLNRASPEADKRLFGVLKDLADRLLAERKASADIVQRVTNALVDLLQGGEGSLEDVSQILSISPRSLQAQLAAADTNFETLLHETRQRLAEIYLRDTDLPLTEIAFLLGFSELSAFTRAATRWFGVPPRLHRIELRNA